MEELKVEKTKLEVKTVKNGVGCACNLGSDCQGEFHIVPGTNCHACLLCCYALLDGEFVFLPNHPEYDPAHPLFN
ncbi:hypothetical protein [Nostoc sp. DedQUE07]|uniref:hypothetical protein n=1 Tax=Nostoc sp. DedQUE07 TaxID=3075392 RepID=UPI002AD4BE02|nr:hypothetical protein [Nostoc sp. DedQUE07]